MSHLLHLDSSSRGEGSTSRQVAATFLAAWRDRNPGGTVTYRDLAAAPLPHFIEAVRATQVDEHDRTDTHREALSLQDSVIDQFQAADAYLVSLPMYNYGIPSQLKAYLDNVMVAGRTFFPDGTPSPVAGRPATVVISYGGGYGPGTPREEWDFVRPYLVKVFAESFGLDLDLVPVELTLAPLVPAMAELVPLADRSRDDAHRRARELARSTAASVGALGAVTG